MRASLSPRRFGALAVVAAGTALACVAAAWDERFPLDAGRPVAWSANPLRTSRRFSLAPDSVGTASVIVVVVVLGGLTVAWAVAARSAARGQVPFRLALAGAVALPLLTLGAPLLLSDDATSYWAQGRMAALYGRNPLAEAPTSIEQDVSFPAVSPSWRQAAAPYGPLSAWLAEGVAVLAGDSLAGAVLLFKVVAVLFSLLVVAGICACSRGQPAAARAHRLVLWGWNPIVILYLVGGAHNDSVAAAGLVLVAVAVRRRGPTWALVGVLVAGLVKPVLLIGLPLVLVWTWSRRPSWRIGLAAISGVAVVALAYLPYWSGGAVLQPVGRLAGRVEDASALGWVVHRLGLPGHFPTSAVAGGALVAVVVGLAIRSGRTPLGLDVIEAIVLVGGVLLLTTTYLQPWYLAWVLAPLAAATPELVTRWWPTAVAGSAVLALKAGIVQPRLLTRSALIAESRIHWVEGLCLVIVGLVIVSRPLRCRLGVARPRLVSEMA